LLRFEQLQQEVLKDVDTAGKRAETAFKQISSTHKAAQYAQSALEAMQIEFLAGTKTSYFVLDQQRLLTRARSAEIRALADYNIALARLALTEGTILEKNQIELRAK